MTALTTLRIQSYCYVYVRRISFKSFNASLGTQLAFNESLKHLWNSVTFEMRVNCLYFIELTANTVMFNCVWALPVYWVQLRFSERHRFMHRQSIVSILRVLGLCRWAWILVLWWAMAFKGWWSPVSHWTIHRNRMNGMVLKMRWLKMLMYLEIFQVAFVNVLAPGLPVGFMPVNISSIWPLSIFW